MSLAIAVIATNKRRSTLFKRVMKSITDQHPDEIIVIADFPLHESTLWRHLWMAPITATTTDALIKRDAAWIASTSDNICYLADDHVLNPDFVAVFKEKYEKREDWDMLAPARFVKQKGKKQPLRLNVGQDLAYIAGHAGVYRRACIKFLPWTCTLHHPNWDVFYHHQLYAAGLRMVYADPDLAVRDIEGGEPWK